MQNLNQAMPTGAYNPYLEDSNIPTNAASYFQAQTAFAAPAQPVSLAIPYHHAITNLTAPISPLRTHWSSQGGSSRVSETCS